MNKNELINSISEKAELTKKDAGAALNAFISTLEETLSKGEKVQLIGFGLFEKRERAERKGINPRTKEEIIIPATAVPVFKAGSDFKEKVNK